MSMRQELIGVRAWKEGKRRGRVVTRNGGEAGDGGGARMKKQSGMSANFTEREGKSREGLRR